VSKHEDAIRKRAYSIWEDEGRPHGEQLEHWLRAETSRINALREWVDKLPFQGQNSVSASRERSG
jgi:hypothetical protein